MKKIPFNIKYKEQLVSGKYKLETRCGLPARIVCWDACGDFPIVALVDYSEDAKDEDSDCGEIAYNYSIYGTLGGLKDYMDLFIITDEPEFTRFEAKLKEIVDSFSDGNGGKITPEGVAYYSKQLLSIVYDESKCTCLHFTPVLRVIDYAWDALLEKPSKIKKTFIQYCKGLADCLENQGYVEDCKLVMQKIGYMMGGDVAMAVQE